MQEHDTTGNIQSGRWGWALAALLALGFTASAAGAVTVTANATPASGPAPFDVAFNGVVNQCIPLDSPPSIVQTGTGGNKKTVVTLNLRNTASTPMFIWRMDVDTTNANKLITVDFGGESPDDVDPAYGTSTKNYDVWLDTDGDPRNLPASNPVAIPPKSVVSLVLTYESPLAQGNKDVLLTLYDENGNPIGSTGTNQSTTTYEWDFGDGTPFDTNPSPNHTYSSDGVYTATFSAVCNGTSASDTVTITVGNATDHFAIAHDGFGVNCQPEPVTLSAHLADDSVDTGYVGTVTLSTSTGRGDWSLIAGLGALVNAGNGSGTYTFVAADNGKVVVGLADTFVETVDVDVTDSGITESAAEDPSLRFDESGLAFLADGSASAVGVQIAAKPSNTPPGTQVLELQAIKTNDSTGACEAALTGLVTVELAFECVDPVSCTANMVSIGAAPIAGNPLGAVAAYSPVSLDFGDATDTTATFTLAYPDAGRIRLHARVQLLDAGGAPTGNLVEGASNGFVVRPLGFDIDFADDRAVNGTAGVSYAADAAGDAFAKAAEGVVTTVTAVVWEPADDADANGIPDPASNLTDNAATTNFGQEMTAVTVSLTSALEAPIGGNLGILDSGGPVGGFAAGAADATVTWDEAGIIDITATSVDYLASGQSVTGTVENVGRFYPARLAVSHAGFALREGPDSSWTCGFTYMQQPFTFLTDPVITITAQNLAGATTENYGGDFFKFTVTPYLDARSYSNTAATSANLDAPNLGSIALGDDADYDGLGTLTLSGESFAYNRPAVLEAPFAAAFDLTLDRTNLEDSDGVCYDPVNPSCNSGEPNSAADYTIAGIVGANLLFGRLALINASGSELLPIAMPIRAEFYTGSGFATNTADTCTSISTAVIDLSSGAEDPPLGTADIVVNAVPGPGNSTATIASDPLTLGVAGLIFSAPGAQNTGYVDTTFDLSITTGADLEWLRFDWDGDSSHDDDPSARATFGVYSGSQMIIYMREPWN